jgi:pSer/pThr/pTyr-binding forkhead associated (FHA) protein
MLQSDATGCFLTDVGSTNGTTVNGAKLDPNTRQLLLDGDEVMLGQTTYRYETIAAPQEETDGGTAELVANPDDLAAVEETGPGPDEVVG